MANPKPAKPTAGKTPPKQWLTSAITSHDDFSTSKGIKKRIKDNGNLGLGVKGQTVTVVQYKGKKGWTLDIETDGINADVISPDGSQVVALTVPVGPVEPDVLTPELDTAKASPLNSLSAIKDIWDTLTSPNLWVRIAEGLLGVVLIAVGLVKMTNADIPIAGKIAKLAA